jgi:NitT/TauT family transport system permease protein
MTEDARDAVVRTAGAQGTRSALGDQRLERPRVKRRRWRLAASSRLARGSIGGLTFLALAEALTRLEIVDSRYLPHASTVVGRMVELSGDGAFMLELWATLYAWMLSTALAALIGASLGLLLGSSSVTYRATSAVIEVMRPIPAVALIPLAVLVWGQGTLMKVILVTFATVWPILYNTIYGVHGVDPVNLETARAFGLPRRAILRHVVFPSAAPFVLTGIRISASIGLIAIVGTELVATTTNGIGSYIFRVSVAGEQMDVVLATAAIAGLLGVVINWLLGVLERRAFAWSVRGGGA